MAEEDAMLMFQRLQEHAVDYEARSAGKGGPRTVGDDFDSHGATDDAIQVWTEAEKAKARGRLALVTDDASAFVEACEALDILPEGFELR